MKKCFVFERLLHFRQRYIFRITERVAANRGLQADSEGPKNEIGKLEKTIDDCHTKMDKVRCIYF